MAILTKEEAKKYIDKALSFAKADETEISIFGGRTGNIRYARNTVSTSGESNEIQLSVTSVFGKESVHLPSMNWTMPLSKKQWKEQRK